MAHLMRPCVHCTTPTYSKHTVPLCSGCINDDDICNRHRGGRGYTVGAGINASGRLPEVPTLARPGSPEKVAVLAERAAAGQRLWHPGDYEGE
jgi:hypothetical protein